MVSQAGYHANHADGKRPAHSYSPYMPANRYTESRVYVPNISNNDHRGLLADPVDKGEGSTRKRIAVAVSTLSDTLNKSHVLMIVWPLPAEKDTVQW